MNAEQTNPPVGFHRIEIIAATPPNEKDLSQSQQQQPQKKAVMVGAISSLPTTTTDGQTDNLSEVKTIINPPNQDNVSKTISFVYYSYISMVFVCKTRSE